MITKEEALLLLGKWKDEATPLRVVARLATLYLESDAILIGFDWESFALRLSGEGDLLELPFGDSKFNFDFFPKSEATALVCLRPDGEIFFLGDMG